MFVTSIKGKEVEAVLLGGTMLGIYRLRNGLFTYCMALPGKPRPTDFTTPAGSSQTLIKLERFSTGEQEVEKTLKLADVIFHNDEVGWITGVFLEETANVDRLLPHVAKLDKLATLSVTADHLSNDSLRIIGKFGLLSMLTIDSNSVDDADLAAIAGLTHMSSLTIHSERITDAGLQHLAKMPKLYTLRLATTKITDAGLEYLQVFQVLESLQLDHTLVTDAGMAKLLAIPNLQTIHLSHTAITDQGVAILVNLPKLASLSLSGTAITDAALSQLAKVQALFQLNLAGTEVTDTGIESLIVAKKLSMLDVSNTRITGTGLRLISASFPKLRELRIQGNEQLTDEDLESLTKLKTLRFFHVSAGQFRNETLLKLRVFLNNLRVEEH